MMVRHNPLLMIRTPSNEISFGSYFNNFFYRLFEYVCTFTNKSLKNIIAYVGIGSAWIWTVISIVSISYGDELRLAISPIFNNYNL